MNPWFNRCIRPLRCAASLVALISLAALVLLAVPRSVHACACGCGIFEVGTPEMFPQGSRGSFSLEYDFLDQSDNWSGSSSAPAADNEDRLIRTSFVTLHGRYSFTRALSLATDVPYWSRRFNTTDQTENPVSFTHGALGDVAVSAQYAGFSADLSSGVSLGFKLPTGDSRYPGFDRDTEIGSGSTDLLIGAYHIGPLTPGRTWNWFVHAQWSRPFAYTGDYRPGTEVNGAVAVSYANLHAGSTSVAPVLGLVGSARARDAGSEANPEDSGYDRLFFSPGIDVRADGLRATLAVPVSVYDRVNGNQLVSPVLFKLSVGRTF